MMVINKTDWNTRQLRKIITRIAKKELYPQKAKVSIVKIKYQNRYSHYFKDENGKFLKDEKGQYIKEYRYSDRCSGLAYILVYPPECIIRVPKDKFPLIDFALLVAHELGHLAGLNHWQMHNNIRYDRRNPNHKEYYSWVLEYQVEKKLLHGGEIPCRSGIQMQR